MLMTTTKKRLGDILSEMGVVDALQLQSALAYQRQWGVPLGQVMVGMRFCAPEMVLAALSKQAGVSALDLDATRLEPRLTRLVPRRVAAQHRVVPLRVEGPRDTVLVVAMAAPATLTALDAVQCVSGKLRVRPLLATDAAIARAIDRLYGSLDEVSQRTVEAIALPEADEDMPMQVQSLASLAADAPFERTWPLLGLDEEGLPLLAPLEQEPQQASPFGEAGVLVYGWGREAAAGLVGVLKAAGLPASIAGMGEVVTADERAVVVAPLPWLEAMPEKPRAQLLVASKSPDLDIDRAAALGARGFLAAPVDPDLLVRAVRRLLRPEQALPLRAAS
jgi:type IV pilus assembly protein PilB